MNNNILINIYIFITFFLFIASCKILDVEDYTFYFKSYSYQFNYDTIIDQVIDNVLINNDDIKISLINSTFIINDKTELHFYDINNWNEISFIYNNNQNENEYENERRRLLNYYKQWNPYDHTTEHHKKNGRFIGESIYRRRFKDARAMCHEFYAELASVRNMFEQIEVEDLCKKLGKGPCWIGLKRDNRKEEWQNTKSWLDGHPLGYTHWAQGILLYHIQYIYTVYTYND